MEQKQQWKQAVKHNRSLPRVLGGSANLIPEPEYSGKVEQRKDLQQRNL